MSSRQTTAGKLGVRRAVVEGRGYRARLTPDAIEPRASDSLTSKDRWGAPSAPK